MTDEHAQADAHDDELRGADERIEEAGKEKKSQADRLVALAIAEARLFHTPDEVSYAVLDRDGTEQTWKLHSKRFRSWLSRRHHEEHEKTPGAQAIQDALNVLDGAALFDGAEETVYVRTARCDGRIYLDLANDDWSVVEITRDGWAIVPRSPVRFRRPAGMLPLPYPVSGKTQLDDLRELLNVVDDEDWLLTVGWLLGALRGDGPYPIKELVGEAGSAKSTHARMTRAVVDPASAPVRRPPREGRDLMIAASNGLVVALDNLSDLPDWLADDLCRLATGGGFATRQLYTDDDEVIFNAMRPIILTGIGGVGEDRNDLPDRTIRIRKPRIPNNKRRRGADVDAEFDRLHPGILGMLLDAVAAALDTADGIAFKELPRMADFAAWAEAAGAELGWERGDFLQAYEASHARAHQVAIEASLIGPPLVDIASNGGFQGTASELLERLAGKVDEKDTRRKEWPKTAAVLGKMLRRIAPDLRGTGLRVEEGDGRHRIPITLGNSENAG